MRANIHQSREHPSAVLKGRAKWQKFGTEEGELIVRLGWLHNDCGDTAVVCEE